MSLLQIWNSTKKCATRKGFTLVEIAVVLVILGLIIGTLAPLMVSLVKKDKIKSATDTVKRARDEIIGYVMTNKKLPDSINKLGHNKDPWHNELFLIIANNLINKDICSIDNTQLNIVKLVPSTNGRCKNRNIITNVACIIGSKGANFNRQISAPNRNRVIVMDYACWGDFFKADLMRFKDNFDDIYEFITLNELKGKICQGSSSNYDVILARVGPQKIKVIREVRSITGLSLKEAKNLVDRAPQPIKKGVSKKEAETIKKRLEAVGASVEIKSST